MPDRKRPAFSVKPLGSASVWKYASSTSSVFSGVNDAMTTPRKYGSMFAAMASSLSPSPKLRFGGPTSPPDGMKPVMTKLFGSCDVRAHVPCRMSEMAGLNAFSLVRLLAALAAAWACVAVSSALPARASA